MSAMERPLKYRDLIEAPSDGIVRELLGGTLIESRSFPRNHQVVASNLMWILQQYLRESGLGSAYPPRVDVLLGPYDIVQPDIIVIRRERLRIYQPEGTVEGPPDLIVEITSPSSYRIDHVQKMALYARTDVPEYWIANPDRRKIALHLLQNGIYSGIGVGTDGLISSAMFPGLRADPKDVFAGLDDWVPGR
jgi:Uma2 family endonuclease